ncbi:MAG: hypothetical protein R3C56_07100 [Pirellulaceae bacterium]
MALTDPSPTNLLGGIEQGIRIQPEGILLRTEDLEPPYGPGNPLDAALRTIRTSMPQPTMPSLVPLIRC